MLTAIALLPVPRLLIRPLFIVPIIMASFVSSLVVLVNDNVPRRPRTILRMRRPCVWRQQAVVAGAYVDCPLGWMVAGRVMYFMSDGSAAWYLMISMGVDLIASLIAPSLRVAREQGAGCERRQEQHFRGA